MATISSLKIDRGGGSRLQRVMRLMLWLVLVLALLLIVAYLVVTSPGFIKRIVLPRVSAAIHADVTVTDISIHPFTKITIHGLNVQVKGQEPLVTVPEFRASYSLWSLLRGNLRVSEVALVSPTVMLVENPDGTSNLGDLLSASGKPRETTEPPRPAKSSKPMRVDVQKVSVSNATFRQVKNYPGNRRDFLEVANVSVALANVKDGQAGTLQLGAYLQMENNPPTGKAGHLQAALNGNFGFTLGANLIPVPVAGQLRLDISRADGVFGDFARFSAMLDCDVTAAEIKQARLSFTKAGAPLGQLVVSGPLDLQLREGRLKVELRGIDRRLLNLLCAAGGMDFGTTTLSSSNDIELSRAASIISLTGRFDADNVQLTRGGQTTPTLNLNASYAVTLDRATQTLQVRSLNVVGKQNGSPLLTAHLDRQMTFAWGGSPGAAGDSALDLDVTGLSLVDWRPFLGNSVSAGNLGVALKLSSSEAGRKLEFSLDSQLQNLSVRLGDDRIGPVTVGTRVRGQAVNFEQFNLGEFQLQIVQQNQSLAIANGSGTYNATNASLDLQLELQVSMPVLGQVIPQAGMSFSSGTAELKGRVTQMQDTQSITGKVEFANLTGQSGKNQFRSFGSIMNLDLDKTPDKIQINKISGALNGSGNAGGTYEITGNYNTSHHSAQLAATLSGINANGVRPFLEPLLGDKKLVSIAVNGDAAVDYDPNGSSTIKGGLQVTNLVVSDPQHQFPATPLEAGCQLDTAVKKQVADIRSFQINLTPTQRGQNQIQLQGQVDGSQPDAVRGNLKLSAASLDLTTYYDLFAGGPNGGGKPAAAAPPAGTAEANAGQEPPAKILPFKNFTVAVDIGRLYLHEVDVGDWQARVNLEGGNVTVKPFKLALNGAPVNATVDLNLGVPGYRYDVAFSADRVPMTPLVNSFVPDRKGQMGGTFTASVQLKGAGVTGAGLQKNLTGQILVGMTNLNLSVVNVRSAVLKKVINVVATIPQLLVSPQNAVASLIGQVTGSGGGLMEALEKSPIQIIDAKIKAGRGQLELQQATVQSTAFKAEAQGAIALAQVLTNSTINIPVAVFVSQPIAKQLNLTSGDTPANTAYVPLPQFLTMTGTIGVPKADINKLALGGMTVKSIGGGILTTTTNGASHLGGFLNQLIKSVKPN
ncbi:MAG: AsmA family protein [Verrucomicrobiia bacterium]